MTATTPIVFFGSSKLVVPIIEILQKNFDLVLVVTTEQNPTDAVPKYCAEHKIPYQSVTTLKDSNLQSLITHHKSPIAVLADFGLIIPDEILNAFPKGIINVHPSLLPKFRGPTPVQSAMLSDNTETGVSIIRLDNEVDHGPLLTQIREAILPSDTGETLHIRLFEIGAKLLAEILPRYLDSSVEPIPQDHTKATFTPKLTRESGYIDSSKLEIDPSVLSSGSKENLKFEIARKVRAYYPWPGVWTKTRIKNKEVRIKFLPSISHPELVSGSFPILFHVQDKKPMTYKDFLNGYPEKKEWLEKLGLL